MVHETLVQCGVHRAAEDVSLTQTVSVVCHDVHSVVVHVHACLCVYMRYGSVCVVWHVLSTSVVVM